MRPTHRLNQLVHYNKNFFAELLSMHRVLLRNLHGVITNARHFLATELNLRSGSKYDSNRH